MRASLVTTCLALGLGTTVLVSPASAAPPLGVSLTRLGTTTAVVKGVCPNDPPDTLFITGDTGSGNQLLGSEPVTCTRRQQRFALPLSTTLTRGQTVTDVQVTISGDGGEINAFYPTVRVR